MPMDERVRLLQWAAENNAYIIESQQELLNSALEQSVLVYGARQYWFAHECPGNAVLIGFSAIALKDIAEGVRSRRRAWC